MAQKVVINHTSQRLVCGPINLKIGANKVEEDDLKKAAGHPIFKLWKKNSWISYGESEDGKSIPDSTDDITQIPAKEAIAIIEATFDLATLDKWLTQEEEAKKPRSTVLTAIDVQMDAENSKQVGKASGGKVEIDNSDNEDNKVITTTE